MDYEGDVSVVRDLAAGTQRIGLLVLPGFIRGYDGSARAAAFEERRLTRLFTTLVGISTGAPTVLYVAGGTVSNGRSIYYKECMTKKFLSFSLTRALSGTMADMDYQCQLYRGQVGDNSADLDAVRSYPGDMYVGVTDYVTGQGALIDAKRAEPDPVAAVHASIAIPLLYRKAVHVAGCRYIDGAIGMPFPASEVAQRWSLNGLIVFANRPPHMVPSLGWSLCESLYLQCLPPGLQRAMWRRPRLQLEGLEYLRSQKVSGKLKYLVFWSEKGINPVTRKAQEVEAAADRAFERTRRLLIDAGV